MPTIKITKSDSHGEILVKEYEVTEEHAQRIIAVLNDLVLKKKARHKELVSVAVSHHCKDKKRTVDEPCSYPVGSCILCPNRY